MLEVVNSVWFATRVRVLEKRTHSILTAVQEVSNNNKDKVEQVERELNTSSAMLELLLDYAKCHNVMSSEDYEITKKSIKISRQLGPYYKNVH